MKDRKEKLLDQVEVCNRCGLVPGGCECQQNPFRDDAPKTEKLAPGVEQIPWEAMESIGQIFSEGEIKYGLDNWKGGVDHPSYNKERLRHAIRHLMLWANGDRSENHLAKVAWFCVTQLWIDSKRDSKK